MVGDDAGIITAEHFKTHRGTPSGGNQAPHYLGLQQVVVGVVVPLAQEHKVSASQTFDQTWPIDELGRGDAKNTPGERMISTKR